MSGYYQGMHGTGEASSMVDSLRGGRRSGRLRFAGKAGMCLRTAGAACSARKGDRCLAVRLSGIRKACGPSPCSSGTSTGKNSTEMCTAGSQSSACISGNCAGPTERQACEAAPTRTRRLLPVGVSRVRPVVAISEWVSNAVTVSAAHLWPCVCEIMCP